MPVGPVVVYLLPVIPHFFYFDLRYLSPRFPRVLFESTPNSVYLSITLACTSTFRFFPSSPHSFFLPNNHHSFGYFISFLSFSFTNTILSLIRRFSSQTPILLVSFTLPFALVNHTTQYRIPPSIHLPFASLLPLRPPTTSPSYQLRPPTASPFYHFTLPSPFLSTTGSSIAYFHLHHRQSSTSIYTICFALRLPPTTLKHIPYQY